MGSIERIALGSGNVSIALTGPVGQTIAASVPDSGSYSWTILPAAFTEVLMTQAMYKVRVTSGPMYDESNSGFTINA